MFTKKKKQFFSLANLTLIVLILLATLNATSTAQAQSTADTAQDALNAAFEQYIKAVPPVEGKQWIMLEPHIQDDWAYATAQQVDIVTGETSEAYAVLLAGRDSRSGWYAVAPEVSAAGDYNALLKSFPTTLIDESTQALLWLPDPVQTRAVAANFSGHRLPFPAGVQGNVPYKEGSGHTNQVDFTIPGGTIYASKPGKVVFVKENSNANCTTPPPDTCWQNANMVVIQHSASEYSWYLHMAFDSVPVNVGSYVDFGTKIGVQGDVGYTDPEHYIHLHYMVSNSVPVFPQNPQPGEAPWPPEGSIQPVDFDETTWANLTVGNNYTSQNTSDPSAVAWGNGRIDLFVHGEDNQLWQKTYNGSWGGWSPLGGTLMSSPDAASWGSGHIDVYVRGLDNNIYYRRYQNGSWANWASAGQPGVGAISDPSAVSSGSGRIDLFVRGGDNALWHRLYSNGAWGNWESFSGVTLTTGPDAANPGNGQLHVFLAGPNKAMWRCTYSGGSCTWGQVPGGATTYDQSGVSPSLNRVDVFARGTDGQLFHRIWNGSSWGNWEPLGGFLTSGPDAASWRVNNHLDVFLRGSDNNIYHRWQSGGGWSGWESLGKP